MFCRQICIAWLGSPRCSISIKDVGPLWSTAKGNPLLFTLTRVPQWCPLTAGMRSGSVLLQADRVPFRQRLALGNENALMQLLEFEGSFLQISPQRTLKKNLNAKLGFCLCFHPICVYRLNCLVCQSRQCWEEEGRRESLQEARESPRHHLAALLSPQGPKSQERRK